MEYLKLILGIGFLAVFAWLFIRNSKRSGVMHTLLRIDTIAGIAAGVYLIISSAQSPLL